MRHTGYRNAQSGAIEAERLLRRRFSTLKILIVSGSSTGFFPHYFKRMKVDGYVSKDDPHELIATIRAVIQGQAYFSTHVAQTIVVDELTQKSPPVLNRLSSKELAIMIQILQGKSHAQIAEKQHLSSKTVSQVRINIFRKLEVESAVELLYLAVREELIPPENH